MSRLSGRLDKLEDQLGGDACPACGSDGSAPATFRVVTDSPRSRFFSPEPVEPECCPGCGRILTFTLNIVHDSARWNGADDDDEGDDL